MSQTPIDLAPVVHCTTCGFKHQGAITANLTWHLRQSPCEPCKELGRILWVCHDFEHIPRYMHEGMIRYLMHGILPGDFLLALLHDHLVETFGRADQENTAAIRDWAHVMYNIPLTARREYVDDWHESGGLCGMANKKKNRESTTDE